MHWCLWCHCPGWLFWLDRHVSSITNINQLLQPYWSPAWVSNIVMSVSVSDMIFRSSVCGYGHAYVCNHDVLLTGLHVLYKIVPEFLAGSFGVTTAPLGHIDVLRSVSATQIILHSSLYGYGHTCVCIYEELLTWLHFITGCELPHIDRH